MYCTCSSAQQDFGHRFLSLIEPTKATTLRILPLMNATTGSSDRSALTTSKQPKTQQCRTASANLWRLAQNTLVCLFIVTALCPIFRTRGLQVDRYLFCTEPVPYPQLVD